ncbi:hypothetical protein BGZ65_009023 [Modicella reniformis]|uniref:Uncharacterized protein n=1 Tax=Modicella reniformis TaxID=1440133 RepID=A0A9P6MC09_9FUNG|nr:hypothetical protein BGZ65_009023 [Modicella reniformis]
MPDLDKLKANLQKIDNGQSKKITETIDLQPIKTKLAELEVKLTTLGISDANNSEARFNALQVLVEELDQKVRDIQPIFEKVSELKAMVQQVIDAQPQEAQEVKDETALILLRENSEIQQLLKELNKVNLVFNRVKGLESIRSNNYE